MKTLKKWLPILVMTGTFAFAYFGFIDVASAADPLKDAGITKTTNSDKSGLFADLKNIVIFVQTIGAIWVVCCLVFAGMKLSASQGNPQARTAGMIGIGMAALGLYVIIKAYSIAGWIAGLS